MNSDKRDSTPNVTIANVVAKVTFPCNLDLDEIAACLTEARFDPEKFPAVYLKFEEENVTCGIYKSGIVICTGAKSTDAIDSAIAKLVSVLKEIWVLSEIGDPVIEVKNIVATMDVGHQLNLERLIAILEHAVYEPEQAPFVVYKDRDIGVTYLFSHSGKVVITGAGSIDHVDRATLSILDRISPVCHEDD